MSNAPAELPVQTMQESHAHAELNEPSADEVNEKSVDFFFVSFKRYGWFEISPQAIMPESGAAKTHIAFPSPKDLCHIMLSLSFLQEKKISTSTGNASNLFMDHYSRALASSSVISRL